MKGHTLDLILSRSSDTLDVKNPRIGDMVSDHFLVSCDLSFHKSENKKRSITYRKIKKIDVLAFRKDISNLSMMSDYGKMDLTDLCNAYDTQLREL